MWRRLLAIAGWALPQPSANLNPMPSVARLSRACAVRAGLSGSVGGHVFSFAALGCQVVEVLSPAPGRAALLSHAVCPAASSAPRGAFAYSVYPLWGLETVSRAALLITARGYCSWLVFKEPFPW